MGEQLDKSSSEEEQESEYYDEEEEEEVKEEEEPPVGDTQRNIDSLAEIERGLYFRSKILAEDVDTPYPILIQAPIDFVNKLRDRYSKLPAERRKKIPRMIGAAVASLMAFCFFSLGVSYLSTAEEDSNMQEHL